MGISSGWIGDFFEFFWLKCLMSLVYFYGVVILWFDMIDGLVSLRHREVKLNLIQSVDLCDLVPLVWLWDYLKDNGFQYSNCLKFSHFYLIFDKKIIWIHHILYYIYTRLHNDDSNIILVLNFNDLFSENHNLFLIMTVIWKHLRFFYKTWVNLKQLIFIDFQNKSLYFYLYFEIKNANIIIYNIWKKINSITIKKRSKTQTLPHNNITRHERQRNTHAQTLIINK